mmetsp:Transcript_20332/g.63224  ORF Transcript_20332/g.63224 Transcript_20332/m.63224 type:complete len:368 (+) Transcript_20332:475-1578(+)
MRSVGVTLTLDSWCFASFQDTSSLLALERVHRSAELTAVAVGDWRIRIAAVVWQQRRDARGRKRLVVRKRCHARVGRLRAREAARWVHRRVEGGGAISHAHNRQHNLARACVRVAKHLVRLGDLAVKHVARRREGHPFEPLRVCVRMCLVLLHPADRLLHSRAVLLGQGGRVLGVRAHLRSNVLDGARLRNNRPVLVRLMVRVGHCQRAERGRSRLCREHGWRARRRELLQRVKVVQLRAERAIRVHAHGQGDGARRQDSPARAERAAQLWREWLTDGRHHAELARRRVGGGERRGAVCAAARPSGAVHREHRRQRERRDKCVRVLLPMRQPAAPAAARRAAARTRDDANRAVLRIGVRALVHAARR